MFRLIYKTFLVAVMSGSLSIMNMTAFAEDTNHQAVVAQKFVPPSNITRDKDGVMSKTENYHFKGNKGDDDSMLHSITMLAVGYVGTKLLLYKKWTPDMTAAAVGSGVYILGEIANIINAKKQLSDMEAEVTKRSDGKNDQQQIESLQKLKESYLSAKSAVKTRKTLQLAAAASYLTALGISITQRLTQDGQFASCHAGIMTAQVKLSACALQQHAAAVAAGATPGGQASAALFEAQADACTACTGALTALDTAITAEKVKSEVPAPSLPKSAASAAADAANTTAVIAPCGGPIDSGIKAALVTPSCHLYHVTKNFGKAFGSLVGTEVTSNEFGIEKMLLTNNPISNIERMSIDQNSFFKNKLKKLLDVFLPQAEAGMMGLLGLGAGALAVWATSGKAISTYVDTLIFTPGGRMVVWGTMATAAKMGADSSQKEMDKIDSNIQQIDQVLNDMNRLAKGVSTVGISEQAIKYTGPQKFESTQDFQLNPDVKVKTDCLAGSSKGGCTPLANQLKGMPGFSDLPASLQSIASQSAALGDGISGTNSISGSTLASAGALAGQSNAISKMNDDLKNKLNESFAKAGKPKVDFANEENKLMNELKAHTAKALKDSGTSAGSFLSSLGLSPISSATASTAPANKAATPASKAQAGVGVGARGAAPAKDKGMNFDFKETQGTPEVAATEIAKPKDEAYDVGSNDINTNSGESIFQLISNRYLKSGYPKLLEEVPATK